MLHCVCIRQNGVASVGSSFCFCLCVLCPSAPFRWLESERDFFWRIRRCKTFFGPEGISSSVSLFSSLSSDLKRFQQISFRFLLVNFIFYISPSSRPRPMETAAPVSSGNHKRKSIALHSACRSYHIHACSTKSKTPTAAATATREPVSRWIPK